MKTYQPKPIYILILLITVFCILIVNSCKRDQKFSPSSQSISDAQRWFESTYPKNIHSTSLITQSIGDKRDLSQIIKPDWKHAVSYTRLGKKVIELPVDPSVKVALTLKTNKWVFNKAYSRSSYVLINDKEKYNGYLLTIIADSDYVKNDPGRLSHNSYRKLDPDFSGLVLYYTPKGDYIGGYGYKQGKLVIPQSTTDQSQSQKV